MKIGVLVALDREYSKLVDSSGDGGKLGQNEIILEKTGIGKVNSAVSAYRMIQEHHPDCIISSGVAGGLGRDVKVMDVVVGSQLVYHDVWCGEGNEYGQVQGLPPRFLSSKALCGFASSMQTDGLPYRIHQGLICSGDQFITEREKESAILDRFPQALAVDMESASVAQVCHLCSVPFLSFRIISDSVNADRNAVYEDFWSTLSERSFTVVKKFLESLPSIL